MSKNISSRITIKDIAKRCGYTANTVSRALRDDGTLPIKTRDKICEIALEMGYIRNSFASMLRSGKNHTIAVIVNDILNPHFAIMLNQMDYCLRLAGYNMMILCTHSDEQLGKLMIHSAISYQVDGVLYFPVDGDKDCIHWLEKNKTPFVLIDRWISDVYADTARCDDEQGGYIAGSFLLEQGHKTFVYIAGPPMNSSQIDRQAGFLRAMNGANISKENIHILSYTEVENAAKHETLSQLIEPLNFTAIVSFNDELAYHIINALSKVGIRVPQDISIIGFDYIRRSMTYLPPLTSVSVVSRNVAETSVQLLLNRIREPLLPPQSEVLPIKIYDHGTTRAI